MAKTTRASRTQTIKSQAAYVQQQVQHDLHLAICYGFFWEPIPQAERAAAKAQAWAAYEEKWHAWNDAGRVSYAPFPPNPTPKSRRVPYAGQDYAWFFARKSKGYARDYARFSRDGARDWNHKRYVAHKDNAALRRQVRQILSTDPDLLDTGRHDKIAAHSWKDYD